MQVLYTLGHFVGLCDLIATAIDHGEPEKGLSSPCIVSDVPEGDIETHQHAAAIVGFRGAVWRTEGGVAKPLAAVAGAAYTCIVHNGCIDAGVGVGCLKNGTRAIVAGDQDIAITDPMLYGIYREICR